MSRAIPRAWPWVRLSRGSFTFTPLFVALYEAALPLHPITGAYGYVTLDTYTYSTVTRFTAS